MNSTQTNNLMQGEYIKTSKNTIRFILITSKFARSGKDLMADIIYNQYKINKYVQDTKIYIHRFRFAAPLIKAFEDIFGYSWDIDKLDPIIRNKCIALSEFCKSKRKTVWIDKTIQEINSILPRYLFGTADVVTKKKVINFIFTDCRYQYEYDRLKELLVELKATKDFVDECDIKLILIKTTENGNVTDRDTPTDSIFIKPDIIIYNGKESIAEYEKDIKASLGFLFE